MIRLATTSDLPAIALIDPFSGDRDNSVTQKCVFVYLLEKTICGFVSMSSEGLLGRPYIQYLAVQPEYQRQGIAKELLIHIEQLFSKQRLFISTESIVIPPLITAVLSRRF